MFETLLFIFSDLIDTQAQTLALRIFSALIIFACGIELIISSKLIANRRLTWILYKGGIALLCFFGARFIAGFADDYFAFGIGLFSNLVNIGFWAIVYYKCRELRKRLASDEIGATGRNSLSESFDEILDGMTTAKRRLSRFG